MTPAITRLASFVLQRPTLCLRRNLPVLLRPRHRTLQQFSYPQFWDPTPASEVESKPTLLLSSPSPAYLEQQKIDFDLPPLEEVKLVITDRAAEQLQSIAAQHGNSDIALRIAVESGGCYGYQYKMELATEREPDDYHLTHPTLQPSNVVVDAMSLSLLNGSTLDYNTELIGSSFRVEDNPRAKGSGCGCGVSWELKLKK